MGCKLLGKLGSKGALRKKERLLVFFFFNVPDMITYFACLLKNMKRGASVAQSVKHLTRDFG